MKLLLQIPRVYASAEIHVAGDLVEITANMTQLAKKPRQLAPLNRRASHLARRGCSKQHLTAIAAGSKPGAIGLLIDRRSLLRRETDREVLAAHPLFAAVTHGNTQRRGKGGKGTASPIRAGVSGSKAP